jgi:hypothetical protein
MFLLLLNGLASEFPQICKAVAIGFGIMGFIGYFVKLIAFNCQNRDIIPVGWHPSDIQPITHDYI